MLHLRLAIILLFSLSCLSCTFLPSVMHKLTVSPIKNVPCWDNMGPNTSCGSVTVSPEEAEGFIVVVGWKRYDKIIAAKTNSKLSVEERVTLFSKFATAEVVSRGYCEDAFVPKEGRQIMSWEGSGDRGVYVVCGSEKIPHPLKS